MSTETTLADLSPAERYRVLAGRFTDLLEQVPDDRWDSQSPCEDWTARDVVAHVVESERGFVAGAGEELPAGPDAATDPAGAWRATRDGMQALLDDPERADREFEGRSGKGTIGSMVGRFHCVDLVVHGWDLSQAGGVENEVPSDQLAWVRAQVEQLSDMARSPGAFGPELPEPDGADETTRTMAFLGRQPVSA